MLFNVTLRRAWRFITACTDVKALFQTESLNQIVDLVQLLQDFWVLGQEFGQLDCFGYVGKAIWLEDFGDVLIKLAGSHLSLNIRIGLKIFFLCRDPGCFLDFPLGITFGSYRFRDSVALRKSLGYL